MEISDDVKEFLTNNKPLLEKDDFASLYKSAIDIDDILWRRVVNTLLMAGITPERMLENLSNIPFAMFAYTYIDHFEVPNHITAIEAEAFKASTLKSIKFHDNISEICQSAFAECRDLKSIELPEGLTDVERKIFANCSGIESVKIGSKLSTIESYMFTECEHLKNVIFPNNIKEIDYAAFARCHSLTDIRINDGCEWISDAAFYNCRNLAYVYIPKSVTHIGDNAFARCHPDLVIELEKGSTIQPNEIDGKVIYK